MLESLKLENIRSQYEMSRLMAGMSKDLGKAYAQWLGHLLINPSTPLRGSANLAMDWLSISRDAALRMAGVETAGEKLNGDRRFRSEAWEKHPTLDLVRRLYMADVRTVLEMVDQTRGMDEEQQRKVRFFTAQFLDAIAPSNFPLTNPEVIEATVGSKGGNLAAGLMNLWEDLDLRHGRLNISMSDLGAFEVGRDLAVTPGEVVYQNDLIQLIQYTPTTEKVYKRPLLIIPPWINKYYILDLREKNSFVKWAVAEGFTVFVISWVNPDAELAQKTFEDYMLEAPLAALEAIEAATGEPDANVVGYCLGGTLLAATLAAMAVKKDDRFKSATFLTTMTDFTEAGELGVFIDEEQLASLEEKMHQRGYLEGAEMATTFNMLRANDLIWSFVVNNYLLGKDPFPFDLLYWNADSTRMPAAMHSFYLRRMYQENLLVKPGGIELAGVPIDLTKIELPVFMLSTREDHIAPWTSTYAVTQLFSGPVKFVLAASGHIAGVVNPPAAGKYGHWTNAKNPKNPDTWLKGASEHSGSWWPTWSKWLAGKSGAKVAARQPGDGKLKVIEDAPGTYVKVMAHD